MRRPPKIPRAPPSKGQVPSMQSCLPGHASVEVFMSPTIALVTMVKNGEHKLPRLFESVSLFVDKAIILDTGSTDQTLLWLAEQKLLPVTVHQKPFENFEVTRNYLNDWAKGMADWLLLLDDDMVLNFPEKAGPQLIKEHLDNKHAAYLLKHVGGLEYWVTRLLRGDLDWKFKGVTHEYLVGGGPSNPRLSGVEVAHYYN